MWHGSEHPWRGETPTLGFVDYKQGQKRPLQQDEGPSAATAVNVQLWHVVLHPTKRHMGGYVVFKCDVTGPNGHVTKFMGTNATASANNEWSFPVSSQSVVMNMVDAKEKYLQKYLKSALMGGRYYVQNGVDVNTNAPTPDIDAGAVTSLIDAMRRIARRRASNGQPEPTLRAEVSTMLNLDARRSKRERGEHGDMSLAGLEWAFLPAASWQRYALGERRWVDGE